MLHPDRLSDSCLSVASQRLVSENWTPAVHRADHADRYPLSLTSHALSWLAKPRYHTSHFIR